MSPMAASILTILTHSELTDEILGYARHIECEHNCNRNVKAGPMEGSKQVTLSMTI
jgi:hypothetical protein